MISPAKVPPAKHKVRHRKVKMGQTIYKGHPSWNIMLNIKLGISYTVGRVSPESKRQLTAKDFSEVYKQQFPPNGSSLTPGHQAEIFTFKDHAPLAFRHLREHWGVDAQEYMVSICGEHSLRELGTPGKSGAVFYLTEDNKFVIKTVSRKESKFLRQILPNYYTYAMRSANTLLPRFLGLIRITTSRGRNIRLVVMNFLQPEDHHVHEKFDLKGSTLGRWATDVEKRDPNVTLKDLDFKHNLQLPPKRLAVLNAQVEADCQWLRMLRIMDYSMLVMLHFPARAVPEEAVDAFDDRSTVPETSARSVEDERARAPTPARQRSDGGKEGGKEGGSRRRSGESADDGSDSDDDLGTVSSLGIPKLTDEDFAAAFEQSRTSTWAKSRALALDGGVAAVTAGGGAGGEGGAEEVVVFMGIIDVLQQYGARKKLEHRFKSLRYRHDRAGISVTDPARYSERFCSFILGRFSLDASVPKQPSKLPPAAADVAQDGAPGAAAAVDEIEVEIDAGEGDEPQAAEAAAAAAQGSGEGR